jgi:hypothetical protein
MSADAGLEDGLLQAHFSQDPDYSSALDSTGSDADFTA